MAKFLQLKVLNSQFFSLNLQNISQMMTNMDKALLEKLAMENERVQEFTKGMTVVKSIVVPGKLVNIVVKPA